MAELRTKLQTIKAEALELMKAGKLSQYIAKLQDADVVEGEITKLQAAT